MKISVEFSDSEIAQIRRLTGIEKKGPAIRALVLDGLRLHKRRALNQKVLKGDWSVDLPTLDELRTDRVVWE